MLNGITALSNEASTLSTTFSTALTTVKGDVLDFVGVALPVALAIVGTFVAVKLGINFFKQVVS